MSVTGWRSTGPNCGRALARMRSRASGASEGEDTTGRVDSSFGGDLWRGLVGMVLVVELGLHGVRSTLVDRAPQTTRFPKVELTGARSMERLDRLGLVEEIRGRCCLRC